MKRLNKLVITSFLGPFLVTFFVALFVLLMQFLWKYIDDLVGKGLEWYVIARLLLYSSVYLVPMALPLAILISSIMAFGNLGEHYELVAVKAAGISLNRMLRPLFLTALLISGIAFLFSNNILPFMTLKQQSLLYDITHQKPALNIQPGVFYSGIDGYSIRVGAKDSKTNSLLKIMIYDHVAMNGNTKVIVADSGTMTLTPDNSYLLVNLFRGFSYEELRTGKENSLPNIESRFDEELIRFDLSSFKLSRTNEDLFKENKQMLNVKQLSSAIDSLSLNLVDRKTDYVRMYKPMYAVFKDSLLYKNLASIEAKDALDSFPKNIKVSILDNALAHARSLSSMYKNNASEYEMRSDNVNRYEIELHRKFTLSIACFVLFLIGAPLGAIIRKGGIGVPIIVAIIFFLIFHITSITGEKMAKEGSITPASGMWAATFILLPVGLFLLYKATTDSALFDSEIYSRVFGKLKKLIPSKKKIAAK